MTQRHDPAKIARNNRALLIGTLIAIALVAVSCLATAMDGAANAIHPTTYRRSA
ncbi:hypothetical protein [Cupriavidus malaysiensis]|uniref:hypothetical protein n=1 Tax=Cupriavidus malaysiensis TaxID=367825 RepID=UPI0012FF8AB8|nr:hypothetical protein [Cupriavidus malaysiensis]